MQRIMEQMTEKMTNEVFPALKNELEIARNAFERASTEYEAFVENCGCGIRSEYYRVLKLNKEREELNRCYRLVMEEIKKLEEMIQLRVRRSCDQDITERLEGELGYARHRMQFLEDSMSELGYDDTEYFEEISSQFSKFEALEEEMKQAERTLTLVETKQKACEDVLHSLNTVAEALGANA